jgi:hypothetical protein
MPPLVSIFKQIQLNYPQFKYRNGDSFYWSAKLNTIFYTKINNSDDLCVFLHELSHAILNHDNYIQDIELISLERSAWQKARDLAKKYRITIDENLIQDHLDSYRHWLYSRSRCPKCTSSSIQSKITGNYYCSLCEINWRANEAKLCGLRRKIIP